MIIRLLKILIVISVIKIVMNAPLGRNAPHVRKDIT